MGALDAEFARCLRDADVAVRVLRHLGVPFRYVVDCGGAGCALVATSGRLWDFNGNGKPAIVQPVYYGGAVVDLVAWFPNRPGRWWLRRGEHGLALGLHHIMAADSYREPIRLSRTPLSWLRAGGDGACLLTGQECLSLLLTAREIVCEDVEHAREVEKMLRRPVPRITVPRQMRRAA